MTGLASVALTRADFERDLANLARADTLGQSLRDSRRLARVRYWLGRTNYVLGRTDTALAWGRQALALAEGLGDEDLSVARLERGDHADAIRLGHEGVTLAAADPWSRSVALRGLSESLLRVGDLDEAERTIREAQAIQEGQRLAFELARSMLVLAEILQRKRAAGEADAIARQAVERFDAMGIAWGAERARALSRLSA